VKYVSKTVLKHYLSHGSSDSEVHKGSSALASELRWMKKHEARLVSVP